MHTGFLVSSTFPSACLFELISYYSPHISYLSNTDTLTHLCSSSYMPFLTTFPYLECGYYSTCLANLSQPIKHGLGIACFSNYCCIFDGSPAFRVFLFLYRFLNISKINNLFCQRPSPIQRAATKEDMTGSETFSSPLSVVEPNSCKGLTRWE